MRKFIPIILIVAILLGALVPPAGITFAQTPNDGNLQKSLQDCGVFGDDSLAGCFQGIIYGFFVWVPSLLLTLAAKFFDYMAMQTLQSDMYRYPFIENIWKVVRDFSNIFFILILLYAAMQLVLGIGHDAKKVVAWVILIALLVNFSLFFTKIVIDSSNIVALVFYNRIDVSNAPQQSVGSGERELGAALISRFNVNKFFSGKTLEEARTETIVDPVLGTVKVTKERLSFVAGTGLMAVYALVILPLAYAFFIVGLSFLGRIVTLMFLMMVAPLAFVTYAVPKMRKIDGLGFDSWWQKLLSSGFAAAIFMFILYITSEILRADPFSSIDEKRGIIALLLSIFVPGILITMLLLKGASWTKKASSDFSDKIIGGAVALGGLALGGVALGTAALGRTAVGRTTAAVSRRTGARTYGEQLHKYEQWEKTGRHGAPPPVVVPTNVLDRIGAQINKSQWKAGTISHGQHEMEELKKKVGVEGLGNAQLSGVDKQRMEEEFIRGKRGEIETEIRRGYDAKGNRLRDPAGNVIENESEFKTGRRQDIIDDIQRTGNPNDVDLYSGELTDQGKKKVEDRLNQEFNEILRSVAQTIGGERYRHLEDEAKQRVGLGTKLAAKTTSGSYDPRALGSIKPDKGLRFEGRAAAALIAAVATGIRLGLKPIGGIDPGTPKRDFISDIKDTITSALKNVNIKVDTGDRGGSHKEDHGTGGGGHH